MERQLLTDALERHNWIQTRAADSLGISERVLRYKMERLGISKK
jgi:two-component system response regulator AtoC